MRSRVVCKDCGGSFKEEQGNWYFEDRHNEEVGHYTYDYFVCIHCEEKWLYDNYGTDRDWETTLLRTNVYPRPKALLFPLLL